MRRIFFRCLGVLCLIASVFYWYLHTSILESSRADTLALSARYEAAAWGLIIFPAAWFAFESTRLFMDTKGAAGRCEKGTFPACCHDLQANSTRCPECGAIRKSG
jgi:hypothetical protein